MATTKRVQRQTQDPARSQRAELSPIASSAPFTEFEAWDKPRVILHLSDLHFGAPEGKGHYWNSEGQREGLAPRDQPELLRCLVRDLKSVELSQYAPDIVVVSGDLLDKGDPSGIALAVDFLKRLSKELSLDPSRFVLAPGNHDVDRSRSGSERYRHFDALWNTFYGKSRPKAKGGSPAMERCEVFAFSELGLELVAFNTCENLGDGNEHGSLGETQRLAAGAKLASTEPTVRTAVMHHHLRKPPGVVRNDYSVMDDAGIVEEWIAQERFSLVLHGHQHVDWLQRAGTGTSDILVTAAGSLGVGSYGRRDWTLPLQYQLIVLESPTRGKRLRRDYDEQHRRWCAAGRGKAEEPFRIGAGAPLALGTPPFEVASLEQSSAVNQGSAHLQAGGTKGLLGDFEALLAVVPSTGRTKFEHYRQLALDDAAIDLWDLVADAQDLIEGKEGSCLDFARLVRDLILRMTVAAAERMKVAQELRCRGLSDGGALVLPVGTYLFVEILMAHAEGRAKILPEYDQKLRSVRGCGAAVVRGADVAANRNDAILRFEQLLWQQLFKTEGAYSPKCGTSMVECEARLDRNDRALCNQTCNRYELHGELGKRAKRRNRAYLIVDGKSERELNDLAASLRGASLVQFGGTPSERDAGLDEIEFASLFADFIRLTQPHLGTP